MSKEGAEILVFYESQLDLRLTREIGRMVLRWLQMQRIQSFVSGRCRPAADGVGWS